MKTINTNLIHIYNINDIVLYKAHKTEKVGKIKKLTYRSIIFSNLKAPCYIIDNHDSQVEQRDIIGLNKESLNEA
jgi:hypothetical protein